MQLDSQCQQLNEGPGIELFISEFQEWRIQRTFYKWAAKKATCVQVEI